MAAAQVLPPWSGLLADHDVTSVDDQLKVCMLMVDLMGDREVAKLWPLGPPAAAMMSAHPWGTTDVQQVRSVIEHSCSESGSSRLRCKADASEGIASPLVPQVCLVTGAGCSVASEAWQRFVAQSGV